MTAYIVYPGDTITVAAAPVPEVPQIQSYSQTDPQWANTEFSPGYTFARYGCLVCSYAMIASQMYYDSSKPLTFAAKLRDVGAISGGMVSNPSRIPEAYPALNWGGAIHWRDKPADMAFLTKELRDNGPTVIELAYNPTSPVVYKNITGKTIYNTHFLVLLEIDGMDARVIDPIDGLTKRLLESRYYLPKWEHLGAQRIITGCRLLRVMKV